MGHEILSMKGITKVYSNGVYANNCVDFSLREGEIHGLVGENGAGKTTLMNILFGIQKPDEGSITLAGEEVVFNSPYDAIEAGICMVHQHFMLVPSLTVAENTALGMEKRKGPFVDKKAIRDRVTSLSEKYNLNLRADDIVGELSVGAKQRVEILKTLYREAKIIILDEPTALLTPQETEKLFDQLLLLKDKGHTIIFISHKLREVKEITDRISVMRKGRMITTVDTESVNEKEISDLIIGASVDLDINKPVSVVGEQVIDVHKLCARDNDTALFTDLNLKVRSGEILGLAGIEGNGQQQLIEILTCARNYDSGEIDFLGLPVKSGRINESRKKGLAYIPSDRMAVGVAGGMSIEENIISTKLSDPSIFTSGLLSMAKTSKLANNLIKDYNIVASSEKTQVSMLSGGNIQKVVIARELTNDVKFLVADEPTRGVDILSADFIHRQIINCRDDGAAVLLISSDLDELLKLSDSIVVMFDGKITAYFPEASKVSQTELGAYMLGTRHMGSQELEEQYYEI